MSLPVLLARAGGGHAFSGGGGGGGFGGGGTGGGGFGGGTHLFFLGGGLGGSAIVPLFILAFFVVPVVWKLIQRRSGSGMGMGGDTVPLPSPQSWTPPATHQLDIAAIQAHDRAFDADAFLSQAQRTFFLVQEAWTQRKPELSRSVMGDALWAQHRMQIQGYIDEHKRNVLDQLAVGRSGMLAAGCDTSHDTITVRFLAASADYDVDDSGKRVRGDKKMREFTEDWTYQRSSSAVTKADGGIMSARCPSCGAPLSTDAAGVCKYCKTPVMSGAYDWVLVRIDQVTDGGQVPMMPAMPTFTPPAPTTPPAPAAGAQGGVSTSAWDTWNQRTGT